MAPGKPKVSKVKRNRTTQRRNRRKPQSHATARTRTSSSSGLGSILHKGVRSILSLLPGSAYTTAAADAVFTGLGWTDKMDFEKIPNTTPVRYTQFFQANVLWNGLFTLFYLTPAMLLGDAICASTVEDSSSPNNEKRLVSLNYTTSRIAHFRVVARNAGPMSIHGQWGIGFWPFTSADDEHSLQRLLSGVNLGDIRQAPIFVDGPAAQPLLLKHYFTLSNWFARTPGGHAKRLGFIAIAYQEQIRNEYTEFSPSDFNPQIEVSGSIVLTTRSPDAIEISNDVITPSPPKAVIKSGNMKYIIGHDKYSCTHEAGKNYCKVKGSASRIKRTKSPRLRLEDMEVSSE